MNQGNTERLTEPAPGPPPGRVERSGSTGFVRIEGKIAEDIPAVPFIGIAYGFIWIALLGYVIYVARALGRVRRDLEELRRKLGGSGGSSGG